MIPQVCCRLRKRAALVPILSQMNQVHPISLYLFTVLYESRPSVVSSGFLNNCAFLYSFSVLQVPQIPPSLIASP
jgi:hypothetical protein